MKTRWQSSSPKHIRIAAVNQQGSRVNTKRSQTYDTHQLTQNSRRRVVEANVGNDLERHARHVALNTQTKLFHLLQIRATIL